MILGGSGLKRKFLAGQPGEGLDAPISQEAFLTSRHPADRSISKMAGSSSQKIPLPSKVSPGNEFVDLTRSSPSSMSTLASKSSMVIDLTSERSTPDKQDLDKDYQMALELQADCDREYMEMSGSSDELIPNLKKSRFGTLGEAKFFRDEEDMAEWTKADRRVSFDYHFGSENLPDLTLWNPDQVEEDSKLAQMLQSQYDAESRLNKGSLDQEAREQSLPMEDEIKQSRSMLYEYGQTIIKKRCVCCRKVLILDESTVQAVNNSAFKSQRQSSVQECPSCKVRTCIGCGKKEHKKLFEKKIDGWTITWCCDDGRLFLIWRLLCYLKGRKPAAQTYLPTKLVTSLKSNTPHNKKSGVGYGDNNRGIRRRGPEPTIKVVEHDPTDNHVRHLLVAISSLLPNWQNENASKFDTEPPAILRVMFRRSALLDKVAELLRNDSIENVGKRIKVYGEVIRFMVVLSQHPVTARMCFEERISYPDSSGVLAVTFGPEPRGRSRRHSGGDNNLEKAQSLDAIMQPLQLQARAYAKQAKAVGNILEDELPAQVLNLCENIIHLASFLKANAPSEVVKQENQSIPKVNMTEWHRENCLEDLPDEEILEVHHYRQTAINLTESNKGRMKRLMTELANLQTSLPEGIYLRHGSSRLDLMKVLIIGPKDTPYENGVFEFDIFCPGNYPNGPPKVHFKTTGGGVAHFNPNLYSEGKVCLSLIGTWSGEPWRPAQSTLLQVFVSIQSMIFCDEPWCNEPGRESHVGQPASLNYNRTIRKLTIDHALLSWARGTSNGIWTTIVERHFRSNADAIIARTKEWAKDAFNNKPSYVPASMPFVPGQPSLPNLTPPPPTALGLDFDSVDPPMPWGSHQPQIQSSYTTGSFPYVQDLMTQQLPIISSSQGPKHTTLGQLIGNQTVMGAAANEMLNSGANGVLIQPDMTSFNEEVKLAFNFVTKAFPPLPFNLPKFLGPPNVSSTQGQPNTPFANSPLPQPIPNIPLPGYAPVYAIPFDRLPVGMITDNNITKTPLAPMNNMSGEMQHLMVLLGALPMQVMEGLLSKSEPMEVAIKDLIGIKPILPSIEGLSANKSYLTYHHTSSNITNGNGGTTGPFTPFTPNKPANSNQFGALGPFTSAMMPSSTKPVYMFQPNPFTPEVSSPQWSPGKEKQKPSWPAEVEADIWLSTSKKKKSKKSIPGAPIPPGASSSSTSQGSLLANQAPQEPVLDDKQRELVELMEVYRKKELMGEPL